MTDSVLYKALGEAVAVRRGELKLTQAALAARVGMSRASIANIERGEQKTLLHQIYRLAKALELARVSDLLPASVNLASLDELDLPIGGDKINAKQKAQVTEMVAGVFRERAAAKAAS